MRRLLSLLIVLGACGDDGVGKLPDAPFPIDAREADAPGPSPVTLTITSDATGVPGVRVYFQNADSTVVLATTTNASGVASALMEPGGFVTAVDPFITFETLPGDLQTFSGVKPGDQLVLHQQFSPANVTMTVLLPLDPNAATYTLETPCGEQDVTGGAGSGGSGNPGGPVFLSGCGTTTDLVVETRDANGISLGSIERANVALVEGGTIDLSAGTYVAAQDATWSYTNVPAGLGSLNVDAFLASTRGTVVHSFANAIVNAGAATTTIKRPVLTGGLGINQTRFFGSSVSQQIVVEWAPAAPTYQLDMTGVLLPEYTAVATYDLGTHAVVWAAKGAGAQPDFALMQFSTIRATTDWRWQIVAPVTTTTAVVFPVLPAPDATFNPVAGDSTFVQGFLTGKVPGGYDAIRQGALAQRDIGDIVSGATGRAVFSLLTNVALQARSPVSGTRLPWAQPARTVRSNRR